MPTNRRRAIRRNSLSPKIIGLFLVGTGRNHISDQEFKNLWNEHGALFFKLRPDDAESSWAIDVEKMTKPF